MNAILFGFAVAASLVSIVLCEPPLNNGYGVPQIQPGTPLNSYGEPAYNNGGDGGHGSHGGGAGDHGDHYGNGEPKSYEFGYKVKDDYTGTDYHQRETSDGNQVRGEYRVALPDGRTQIVTYWADWQSGFHADVRYEGEAQYPQNYQTGDQHGGQYGAPTGQYGAPSTGSGGYDQGGFNGNQGNQGYNYPSPSNQYGPPH